MLLKVSCKLDKTSRGVKFVTNGLVTPCANSIASSMLVFPVLLGPTSIVRGASSTSPLIMPLKYRKYIFLFFHGLLLGEAHYLMLRNII